MSRHQPRSETSVPDRVDTNYCVRQAAILLLMAEDAQEKERVEHFANLAASWAELAAVCDEPSLDDR